VTLEGLDAARLARELSAVTGYSITVKRAPSEREVVQKLLQLGPRETKSRRFVRSRPSSGYRRPGGSP
jgi:hypothetical protein